MQRKSISIFIVLFLVISSVFGQSGKWACFVRGQVANTYSGGGVNKGESYIGDYVKVLYNNNWILNQVFTSKYLFKSNSTNYNNYSEWFQGTPETFELFSKSNSFQVNSKYRNQEDTRSFSIDIPTYIHADRIAYYDFSFNPPNGKPGRGESLFKIWQGYLHFYIYPEDITLKYNSGTEELLPFDTDIQIAAPDGYSSSVYHWQYYIGTPPTGESSYYLWTNFPSSKQGNKTLIFKGSDIFASEDIMLNTILQNKNVHIRLAFDSYSKAAYNNNPSKSAIQVSSNKDFSKLLSLSPYASAPKIINSTSKNVTCFAGTDGTITIQFNRALKVNEVMEVFIKNLSKQTFLPSDFDANNKLTIIGLAAGNHEIQIASKINDIPLYSGTAHKKTITVGSPSVVNYTSSKIDVLCYGDNTARLDVSASGGVGNYSLHWRKSGESSYITKVFTTTNNTSLENLNIGTYEFYVTDSNGCFLRKGDGTAKTDNVIITQPTKAIEYDLFVNSIKEPSGYGMSNGSFSITINGGTPDASGNYTVVWKNKATGAIVTSVTNSISDTDFISHIYSIPSGTYFATITDDNSCQLITEDFLLEQPEALIVNIEETSSNGCFDYSDGELTAHVKGGVKNSVAGLLPYKYKWSIDTGGGYTVIPNQTDSIISNRKAGKYKVEIEDYSWQINTISALHTLTAPSQLVVFVTSKTDIHCYGDNTGQVVINVAGGTGGYKLYWKSQDDTVFPASPIPFDTSSDIIINNLVAGTYSFYIIDNNNCSPENADGTIKIETVTLTQPTKNIDYKFINIVEPSASGLSNGSLSVKADGGTPNSTGNYTAVWKDKTTGAVISTVTNNVSGGYFLSTISNIPVGIYVINIIDSKGCSLEKEYTISEPEPFTFILEQTDTIYCHGDAAGKLQAHARGGIKNPTAGAFPYKYKWFEEINGVYSVIPNEIDSILNGRKAGNYKVEVEDYSWIANKLSQIHTISQPPLLIYQTTSATNILCYGDNTGSFSIGASGGTGSYWLYLKMPNDSNFPTSPLVFDTVTGTTLNGLYAGTYEYYITDDNGCIILENGATKTLSVTLSQPTKAIEYEFTDVVEPSGFGLSNGTISIKVDGGTSDDMGDYFPVWKNKETGLVLTTVNNKTEAGYFISTLHNMPKGTYVVNLVDDNTCNLEKELSIDQPELLEGKIEETLAISCNGMSDGELQVHAKGGIANPATGALPYKYVWFKETNGVFNIIPNQSDSILSNITTGNYKVVIEDYSWLANKITETYYLSEPAILTATATDAFITCGQMANISVSVAGGTAPYKYEWNTGDTTPILNNLVAGTYFAFITDSRGCETTAIAKVTQPVELKIISSINNPVCYAAANGNISVQVSGATAPYTYSWSNGSKSQNLTNIKAGHYTLIVTDANNCSWSESYLLTDPEKLIVDLGEDRTLCSDQKLTLAPTVSDPKTTFKWTSTNGFNSNKSVVTLDKAGIYNLLTTDSKGCQATDQIKLEKDESVISSEMVVSSQVFVNDTIVVVNISSPHPDKTEWLIEKDDRIEIVEQTEHLIKLIFSEEGHYQLGMRSHKNDCFQDIMKTITVVKAEDNSYIEIGESAIKQFIIYPNPNSGIFNVKVELANESSIRLRLIDIGSGNTIDDQKYNGKKEYTIPYNISIPSRTYVMLLETASGRRSLKMIKN